MYFFRIKKFLGLLLLMSTVAVMAASEASVKNLAKSTRKL